MAKGVKRIKWTGQGKVISNFSIENEKIGIPGDEKVFVEVELWHEGTKSADQKKDIHWILQDHKTRIVILSAIYPANTPKEILIPKHLCGPFEYYIEASLSMERDLINKTGLIVTGHCLPKILSSKWCKTNDGENVGEGYFFKYGETVYLNLMTEGLNGHLNLSIDFFRHHPDWKDPFYRYTGVTVTDGEVNLEINDNYNWFDKFKDKQGIEQFYVKVFDPKTQQYITNSTGSQAHGVFLKLKKEINSLETKQSINLSPLVTGEPEKNEVRFESCKFETISIIEKKIPTLIFYNGEKLVNPVYSKMPIVNTIVFKFEAYAVTTDARKTLNNIIQFLREHQYSTIRIDGHACVIGKEEYNQKLSQQRSDAVKNVFIDGGLAPNRIIAIGHGEVNPTDDKNGADNIKYKDERNNRENRRVDISFDSYGHDAQTIIYETIAPSHDQDITIDITEFQNTSCFREKGVHNKNIKINSPEYSKPIDQVTSKLDFPIRSNLAWWNIAPLQYIWPKVFANEYKIHVHSCRYFSNEANSTVLVKVYPDIKWELALEFSVNVSNYKSAKMPAGNIYAKHQEKAREAGYKRWLMNKQGKVPIEVGLGLSAEWDDGFHKRSYTQLFEKKVESIAKIIANATEVLQSAVNYAQSAAKNSAIPVAFDVRYPKFTIVGKWYLEKPEKSKNINTVGEVSFGFDPIIGAEIIIDIIGAAMLIGSGGNPVLTRMLSKFKGSLETLGGKITLTATFSGELSVMAEDLRISALKGIEKGKLTIGGKFGVTITFEMKIEVGKASGKKAKPIATFKASAKLDGYFGGTVELNSDDQGVFFQATLKFSGIMFVAEVEGEVGWWKSNFKIEERLLEEEEKKLEKKYFK